MFLVIIFAVIFSVPALNVNSFVGRLFTGGLAWFDLDPFFHRYQLILSQTDTIRFCLAKNAPHAPGVAQIDTAPRERTLAVRRLSIIFLSGLHGPLWSFFP